MWRGSLLPLGCEAAPGILSGTPRRQDLRLLRSRTGASPLATSKLPRHRLCVKPPWQSVTALEGVRRQFAELFTVAVGEPAQVQEAVIHGHFRDVAHVAGRVAQVGVNAFELLLPDVVFRRVP